MAQIVRIYTFKEGTVGFATQVNAELDQLVAAVNSADGTLTALGTPQGGAPRIGSAALTDIGQTQDSNVREQLVLIAAGLANRYTSEQIDKLIQGINTKAVSSVTFDEKTGVFTIVKLDGTVSTIDTNIEKIPASLTLEQRGDSVFLVITNDDGTKSEADVTSLLNVYTPKSSSTVDLQITGYEITAAVKPASIGLTHLQAEVTAALESYKTTCQAAASSASTSATTATQKATEASNSASSASASSTSASGFAASAQTSASTATTKAEEATESAKMSKSWAVGEAGARPDESTNNAKYWCSKAEEVAGGDFATKTDLATEVTARQAADAEMLKKDGSVQMTGVLKTKGSTSGTALEQIDMGKNKIFTNDGNTMNFGINCYVADNVWYRKTDGTACLFIVNNNGRCFYYTAVTGLADSQITWVKSSMLTTETGLPLTGGTLSGGLQLRDTLVLTHTDDDSSKDASKLIKAHYGEDEYGTDLLDVASDGRLSYLRVSGKFYGDSEMARALLIRQNADFSGYSAKGIYHEGNITVSQLAPTSALPHGAMHNVW